MSIKKIINVVTELVEMALAEQDYRDHCNQIDARNKKIDSLTLTSTPKEFADAFLR